MIQNSYSKVMSYRCPTTQSKRFK